MRICDLRINDFRGVKTGHISFGGHSVLVGPNNAGKTTIIEALALLFGRDRMVRDLTEHDFYGGCPEPADRIRIIATITGFEPNEPAAHRDWFRDGCAIEKWHDAESGLLHAEKTAQHQTLAMQIAFCARFDRESLEVETVRYFHDDDTQSDPFDEEGLSTLTRRLIAELGFFLVPASRTWDAVISFGSELFRRVVESEKAKPFEAVLSERDRLRNPESPLEEDEAIASIIGNIDQELEGFLPSKPRLRLRITSTDSRGLLDAVVPHYATERMPLALPARRHGSGLISLQRVLLLLHFGRQRTSDGKNFWMVLEEPELHVPSPLQRRLVRRLQSLSAQTIVTTHSPIVATLADPTTVIFLRNDDGALSALPLQTAPLPNDTPNSIRKLLQLNRLATIDALMHEVVLLPEGRIDQEWLRLLVSAVDSRQDWKTSGDSNFGSYVGVIPTESGAVVATWKVLSRIHPRVVPFVDGDNAGLTYIAQLLALDGAPGTILRLSDEWEIEDMIGWIVSADSDAAIEALKGVLEIELADSDELVKKLKDKDRAQGGLKENYVAYEAIASVIGDVSLCSERAREFLNALSSRAIGKHTDHFTTDSKHSGIGIFTL